MLQEMAECSCRAAYHLEVILKDFDVTGISKNMKTLHAIEHEGDELRHRLMEKLMKEFITPIEREDIMAITDQIDTVTDAIEDVLLKIYMYDIQEIHKDSIAFAAIITRCCDKLLLIFKEFSNFKKSKTLFQTIIELNHLEEEGDSWYLNTVHNLHASSTDAREVAAWTEIYRCLERVCDTCEETGDLVAQVIMKNT